MRFDFRFNSNPCPDHRLIWREIERLELEIKKLEEKAESAENDAPRSPVTDFAASPLT